MPANLDAHTRNFILKSGLCVFAVISSASIYAQLWVMPRLRSRGLKALMRRPPRPGDHYIYHNFPPLMIGCLMSLTLMLVASAALTYLITVLSGKGQGNNDDHNNAFLSRDLSSSINFCEEDFVDSDYIAEPANTASSLASYCPLALLGIYGPPRTEWSSRVSGHKRFVVAYITLAAIGLGSTTLHALLTANAQGGDELPMLWFVACLSFCAADIIIQGTFKGRACKKDDERWLQLLVSSSAVIATSIYVFSRDDFVAFYSMFLLYSLISIIGVVTICFFIKWNDDLFIASVLLPLAVCTGWVALFAIFAWLSELVLCADVTEDFVYGKTIAPWLWNKAVHPLWHCSSALLAWLLIQVMLAGQGLQRGWGEPRLKWWGAPYVIFYKPSAVTSTKQS